MPQRGFSQLSSLWIAVALVAGFLSFNAFGNRLALIRGLLRQERLGEAFALGRSARESVGANYASILERMLHSIDEGHRVPPRSIQGRIRAQMWSNLERGSVELLGAVDLPAIQELFPLNRRALFHLDGTVEDAVVSSAWRLGQIVQDLKRSSGVSSVQRLGRGEREFIRWLGHQSLDRSLVRSFRQRQQTYRPFFSGVPRDIESVNRMLRQGLGHMGAVDQAQFARALRRVSGRIDVSGGSEFVLFGVDGRRITVGGSQRSTRRFFGRLLRSEGYGEVFASLFYGAPYRSESRAGGQIVRYLNESEEPLGLSLKFRGLPSRSDSLSEVLSFDATIDLSQVRASVFGGPVPNELTPEQVSDTLWVLRSTFKMAVEDASLWSRRGAAWGRPRVDQAEVAWSTYLPAATLYSDTPSDLLLTPFHDLHLTSRIANRWVHYLRSMSPQGALF